jgi:carboxyl-terminal processing protease
MKKESLNSPRRGILLGIISVLMIASFFAGNLTGYFARPVLAAGQPAEFSVFWEAWDLVNERFVDREKVNVTQMTYGAIKGMLAALGDEGHTTFLSPEAVSMHESSLEGAFEGIGAYVSMEDGNVTIVAPINGSPAENAGILPGDIVLAVDGEPVTGLSLNEVIARIRGPANSQVVLTVLHPDATDPVDISIVRQRIELDSVTWSAVPGTAIIYIQISQFAADTGEELERTLKEVMDARIDGKPVQGLILDLRNNPGGYLREAIRVNSQFLPSGSTILIEKDAEQKTRSYESRGWGYARSIPVVVLINQGTASAGEITAGAIKENGRGILVGQTTFGTGTVLNQFSLSDGSAILLGVTNWLTPEGNLIKGQGVKPDIVVEVPSDTILLDADLLSSLTASELAESTDLQFLQALEEILSPMDQQERVTTGRGSIR